jgi:hypothetical protein
VGKEVALGAARQAVGLLQIAQALQATRLKDQRLAQRAARASGFGTAYRHDDLLAGLPVLALPGQPVGEGAARPHLALCVAASGERRDGGPIPAGGTPRVSLRLDIGAGQLQPGAIRMAARQGVQAAGSLLPGPAAATGLIKAARGLPLLRSLSKQCLATGERIGRGPCRPGEENGKPTECPETAPGSHLVLGRIPW